jgi:hypothetical protein
MTANRRIILPAYLVAFSLAVIPPIDALMQTMPLRFGDMRWRWGTFGLLSNAMVIPMIGFLIAFVVATVFEQRAVQRVLGAVAGVIAVATLFGLGMFALDCVQLHKDVAPKMQVAFNVACTTGGLKALFGTLTLLAFAWGGLTGSKRKAARATGAIVIGGSRRPAVGASAAPAPIAPASAAEANSLS